MAEQAITATIDAREHDDEEFTMRATELHALVAWARGTLDRTGFRRILRTERWPAEDIDVLTVVVEHVLATEGRMPGRPEASARDSRSSELPGVPRASQGREGAG